MKPLSVTVKCQGEFWGKRRKHREALWSRQSAISVKTVRSTGWMDCVDLRLRRRRRRAATCTMMNDAQWTETEQFKCVCMRMQVPIKSKWVEIMAAAWSLCCGEAGCQSAPSFNRVEWQTSAASVFHLFLPFASSAHRGSSSSSFLFFFLSHVSTTANGCICLLLLCFDPESWTSE